MTTVVYLALKIFETDFETVIVPFDKILFETVQAGERGRRADHS